MVGIIMLLKAHLKSLYGLSEEYVLTLLLVARTPDDRIPVGDVLNSLLERRVRWVINLPQRDMTKRSLGNASLMHLLQFSQTMTWKYNELR